MAPGRCPRPRKVSRETRMEDGHQSFGDLDGPAFSGQSPIYLFYPYSRVPSTCDSGRDPDPNADANTDILRRRGSKTRMSGSGAGRHPVEQTIWSTPANREKIEHKLPKRRPPPFPNVRVLRAFHVKHSARIARDYRQTAGPPPSWGLGGSSGRRQPAVDHSSSDRAVHLECRSAGGMRVGTRGRIPASR